MSSTEHPSDTLSKVSVPIPTAPAFAVCARECGAMRVVHCPTLAVEELP